MSWEPETHIPENDLESLWSVHGRIKVTGKISSLRGNSVPSRHQSPQRGDDSRAGVRTGTEGLRGAQSKRPREDCTEVKHHERYPPPLDQSVVDSSATMIISLHPNWPETIIPPGMHPRDGPSGPGKDASSFTIPYNSPAQYGGTQQKNFTLDPRKQCSHSRPRNDCLKCKARRNKCNEQHVLRECNLVTRIYDRIR